MAWSWSHTQEAKNYACTRCGELPKDTLAEILAEWKAHQPENDNYFDQKTYDRAYQHARRTPRFELVKKVWDLAAEQATCDNGGWNAWLCPYGCGPHTVPFSPEDDDA